MDIGGGRLRKLTDGAGGRPLAHAPACLYSPGVVPCPRCARANPPTATTCAGCGTPLAFREDRPGARLDAELDLDRRRRAPEPPLEPEPEPIPMEEEPGEPEAGPQRAEAGGEASGLAPAAPARRMAAWAIDGALVAAAALVATLALVPLAPAEAAGPRCALGSGILLAWLLSEAFVAVLAFVYFTVSHALAGATLGKRIAGIRVVAEDGRPPGPARSAVRSVWALLSLALAGAGLIPALASPSRRALHDLLAGTRVVEGP